MVSVHYCTVCCSDCSIAVLTSACSVDAQQLGTTHMPVDVRCHVSGLHPALFVCKTVISLLRLITLLVVGVILLLLTLLFILRGTDGEDDTKVRGTELKSPRSSRKAGGRPDFSCLSPVVAHLFCTTGLFLRHVTLQARSYSNRLAGNGRRDMAALCGKISGWPIY